VERCYAPSDAVVKPKSSSVELSDAKPTKSLAEVYEDEFTKQQQVATGTYVDERTVKQQQQHSEIDTLFKELCYKLDALSNYHFTPKPPQAELTVVGTAETAAIDMEEILPVHVSDAQVLAPQEIFEGKKSTLEMKSQEELTGEEKQKLRRDKKRKRRADQRHKDTERRKIEKINPGLGNKHAKENALKALNEHQNVTVIGADAANNKKRKMQTEAQRQAANKLKL
jgi:U3 small nucleolar RNA-associated protein MPP10